MHISYNAWLMVFIVLPEVNKLRLRLRQNRSKLRLRPSGSGAQHYLQQVCKCQVASSLIFIGLSIGLICIQPLKSTPWRFGLVVSLLSSCSNAILSNCYKAVTHKLLNFRAIAGYWNNLPQLCWAEKFCSKSSTRRRQLVNKFGTKLCCIFLTCASYSWRHLTK